MLRLQAFLQRETNDIYTEDCVVTKTVELTRPQFHHFKRNLHAGYDFITNNSVYMGVDIDNLAHLVNRCLMVLGEDCEDGILVRSEGAGRTLYSAFVPHAKSILGLQPAIDHEQAALSDHAGNNEKPMNFEKYLHVVVTLANVEPLTGVPEEKRYVSQADHKRDDVQTEQFFVGYGSKSPVYYFVTNPDITEEMLQERYDILCSRMERRYELYDQFEARVQADYNRLLGASSFTAGEERGQDMGLLKEDLCQVAAYRLPLLARLKHPLAALMEARDKVGPYTGNALDYVKACEPFLELIPEQEWLEPFIPLRNIDFAEHGQQEGTKMEL